MRGSVGSNINRRKLAAKYKKKTPTSTEKDTAKKPTTNKSVTPQTSVQTGRRTTLSQRTPAPERVREEKIVPVTGEIATQGITVAPVREETGKPTEARDLQDRVISSEIDEDGNKTGRWDANKDMEEMWHIEKFIRGIISPYEQPVQMVKNIVEELPPEKQIVKDTGLDLVINPVMETLTGAKDMGLTNKDFYWPDQLTGIDHPSAPAFLRTGGGSGSDILGGLANNLGYIADVATHKESGNIIAQKYEGSAARFIEQPAYYVGSAIGEVPLWFIGVGQAKAVATIGTKSLMHTMTVAKATGKLPGPRQLKAIVQTERAHSNLSKSIIKASYTETKKPGKNFLHKGFDKTVKSTINILKKDLDYKDTQKIAALAVEKNQIKSQIKQSVKEVIDMKKLRNTTTDIAEKAKLSQEIKIKNKAIKQMNKNKVFKTKRINAISKDLDSVKLMNKFKTLKADKTRSGQEKYLGWVNDVIEPAIQTKFNELPTAVKQLQKTRQAHLKGKQAEIAAKATAIAGNKIDSFFWDSTSRSDMHTALPDTLKSSDVDKLLHLRDKHIKIEADIERTMDDGYTPWTNTIRSVEDLPNRLGSKWNNKFSTRYIRTGDSGVQPAGGSFKKDFSGWSGKLREISDYHTTSINLARTREVRYWTKKIEDSFPGMGIELAEDTNRIKDQIKDTKLKLMEKSATDQKILDDLEWSLAMGDNTKFKKGVDPARKKWFSVTKPELKKRIKELNSDISGRVKEVEKLTKYENTALIDMSTVITGVGKTANKYYFEPKFLKNYMDEDSYQRMLPKEIIYVNRPVVSLRKQGNVITGTVSSPSIQQQYQVAIQRSAPKPAGKIRKTARRLKPKMPDNMKLLNRYMTTDNSSVTFTARQRNLMADNVLRIPKNAPDEVRKQAEAAYMRPMTTTGNKSDLNVEQLNALTGGKDYELWIDRKISPEQRIGTAPINVGKDSRYITKDSDFDRNFTFDEIMSARQTLIGGKQRSLTESLVAVESNIKTWQNQIEKLNKKTNTGEVKNESKLRSDILELRGKIDKEMIRKDEIDSLLSKADKNKEALARMGVGFGTERGLLGIIGGHGFKEKAGIIPVIKNEDTGKLYLFAEVKNKKEVYELDNLQAYENIRPDTDNLEFATKAQDGMMGMDESGKIVKEIRQPDDTPDTSKMAGPYKPDDQFKSFADVPPGGMAVLNTMSDRVKDIDIVRLGIDGAIPGKLESRGIRKLSPSEVRKLEKGNTFSGLSDTLDEMLLNKDTNPDTVISSGGSFIPQKTWGKQVSDYIKMNAARKVTGGLKTGSSRIKGLKRALQLKDDEWTMVQRPSTKIDESGLVTSDNIVKRGQYTLGFDEASPIAKAMMASDDRPLFETSMPDGTMKLQQGSHSVNPTFMGDKMPANLSMYNIIDMGIIGGRDMSELESKALKNSINQQQYQRYKELPGNKNKYEELLFIAREQGTDGVNLSGGERAFKEKLLQAYKKNKSGSKGDKEGKYTSEELKEIIKFDDDGKFTGSKKYDEIVKDIVDNDMLREITAKEWLSVKRLPGRNPSQKTMEKRTNTISIKYNFGSLADQLPEKSLVARTKNKIINRLQGNDNFLTEMGEESGSKFNLLGGIIDSARNKYVTPNFVKRVQQDPYIRQGFIEAVDYARSKGIPINKEYSRMYDISKGSHNVAKDRVIPLIQSTQGPSGLSTWNVQGRNSTGLYWQASITERALDKIQKIDNELNTLTFGKESDKIELGIKVTLPGSKPTLTPGVYKSGELEEFNIFDKRVSPEIRRDKIDIRIIELHLEKSNLSKIGIDAGEYSSYAKTLDDLYEQKETILGGQNQYTAKLSGTQKSALDKVDATIRWIKERKGQPVNVSLEPSNRNVASNLDWAYTFKGSKSNSPFIRSVSSLVNLDDDILKKFDESGALKGGMHENTKVMTKTTRAEAWDEIIQMKKEVIETAEKKSRKQTFSTYFTPKDTTVLNNDPRLESSLLSFIEMNVTNVKVKKPDMVVNNISKVTSKNSQEVTYHYKLPRLNSVKHNIETLEDWDSASMGTKIDVYNDAGFDVKSTMVPLEFKANRSQNILPGAPRGKVIEDPLARDTLKAIDTWQQNRKNQSGMITKGEKKELDRLNKLVKPSTNYDDAVEVFLDGNPKKKSSFEIKLAKWGLIKDKKPDTETKTVKEWNMSSIEDPRPQGAAVNNLKVQMYKTAMLQKMGIDEKAFTSVKKITSLMQGQAQSKNKVASLFSTINNSKTSSAKVSSAKKELAKAQSQYQSYSNQINEIRQGQQMTNPSKVLQQSRPDNIGIQRDRFWSAGGGDLAPNYRPEPQGLLMPNVFASPSMVTPNAAPATQQSEFNQPEQNLNQQPKINTDITSGMDMSVSGLLASLPKVNTVLKTNTGSSSRLDANLGWLSAQLPDQITRPLTRMDSVTSVTSALKIGTKLRTSSMLKLEQTYKLLTKDPSNAVTKKQPVSYQITPQRYRTQSIAPIFLGAMPWEKAAEEARKRKKKPKRKSAKTWWQTPDNWYESNYWGKDGKGSGYMTFKGSEPKRLKDKKNEFGF